MPLTEEQNEIIRLRIEEHKHSKYEVDIDLGEGRTLKGLIVHPNVLRPEKSSSLYLARYLASNANIYKDKNILDLGCGCGIQGIITLLGGSKSVTFSDISQAAVENTTENIGKFNLTSKAQVVQGDLFENVNSVFDLIIFNHPFWPSKPTEETPITKAMMDEGPLLHRFLDGAPKYLTNGGLIFMPFFNFAGDTNNPGIQAKQHGYEVKMVHQINLDDGNIQKGLFSLFQLQL